MDAEDICTKCGKFKLFRELPYCYTCYKSIFVCKKCGKEINWKRKEEFASICESCDVPFK